MLDTQSEQTQYVIKVISRLNPIQIRLPIIGGKIQNDQHAQTITIDSCSFVVTKPVITPVNFISANSQYVKVLFGNGSGCFDQDGRMTKVLQIMDHTTQVVTPTFTRQQWFLCGSADPYVWSIGHQLQLGFTDATDTPIDFSAATGLNTDYVLIIQMQLN